MRRGAGVRTFSAALTPAGAYVVGYRRTSRGLEVSEYSHASAPGSDPGRAAGRLGELIEAQGGRGGRLALALSGFGAYHHILTLPDAPREVLLPVIGRELRRVFPELAQPAEEEPIISYVDVGEVAGEAGPQREILAAAVRRSLIETVREELGRHGVELTHWTVLPRAMQRLHDAFQSAAGAGDAPTADIVVAEDVALLSFFHDGDLRLFSETPRPAGGGSMATPLLERLERGGLYLRQQFRGAGLERVLLSVEDGPSARELAAGIRERLGVGPERFGPYSATPGAMLALGPALDAVAPDPFDLLPADLRPTSSHDRWSRLLAIGSIVLVIASAWWWAWSGVRAEHEAEARMDAIRTALESRAPRFSEVRRVVDARRSHSERAELLRILLASRERLPEMLWPLESAPAGIRIQSLEILPSDGGWTARLQGSSDGATTAQATAAIDELFRSVQSQLPGATVSLDDMSAPQPASDELSEVAEFVVPIAITFRMSFIVPAVEEAVR